MLDAVYLQQDSFNLTDASCGAERQRYVINKLIRILGSEYALSDKDGARSFFNRMLQKFLDLNATEFMSDVACVSEGAIHRHSDNGVGHSSSEVEELFQGRA